MGSVITHSVLAPGPFLFYKKAGTVGSEKRQCALFSRSMVGLPRGQT
jgi:hypothetical protein